MAQRLIGTELLFETFNVLAGEVKHNGIIATGSHTLTWALILLCIVCFIGGAILMCTIGHDRHGNDFILYIKAQVSTVASSVFTLLRYFAVDCNTFFQ